MPFDNDPVGGIYVIRFAIRSPNYVAGSAGWTINRDGSAEFSNVVIRGGELFIQDVDGSYIRIFDENPGDGAVIHMMPATVPAHTVGVAQIRTSAGVGGAAIAIDGPTFDGNFGAGLVMSTDPLEAQLAVQADTVALVGFGSPNLEFTYEGKELGFACESAMTTTPNSGVVSPAAFAVIANAATCSMNKLGTATRVRIDMSLGASTTTVGTLLEFGIRISGTGGGDIYLGRIFFNNANVHLAASGTAIVPAFAAGARTYTPIWRVTAGGNISANNGDGISFTVAEIRAA